MVNSSSNVIHSQHAQRLLLLKVLFVPQAHVHDDLRGLRAGLMLKANPHPAVPIFTPRVALRRDCVSEYEKLRGVPALRPQPFRQQAVLMVEHGGKSLPRNVALRLAVNRIADHHVVSRNALGNGARRAAHAEKPARDLLSGADLRKRPVLGLVQVDLQRLLMRADVFLLRHPASKLLARRAAARWKCREQSKSVKR
jgi:hypothetical protein